MKKMIIFDPAMCCSTGVCGPSIDPELLRVAIVISNLKSKGVIIERHNLNNNPQIYVDNKELNKALTKEGIDILPITMIDGKIVKTKTYPTNHEFCKLLDIPEEYMKVNIEKPKENCCCKGGCC